MSVSAADRHASVLPPPEEYGEVGFNFRMTDLQAAVGLVQLGRLPEIVRRRREIADRYRAALADVEGLRPVVDPAYGTGNVQSFWVEVLEDYPTDRDGLLEALAGADISARRGIMAAHRQPPYRDLLPPEGLPATDRITDGTLILPVYHSLTDAEQDRVIDVLRLPVGVLA
jgi:dTDP-4-amino-4,6-dideoxygalactose transaminase